MVSHTSTRASLLARLKGSGNAPALLYNGHLDTVPPGDEPWSHDPYGGELADGRIWGRGSADMKGGMAAMMAALQALSEANLSLSGDLILAATAGEETDSLGAVALSSRRDLGPVRAVVIPEPSSNEIFIAEKGVLWLEVTTRGKTAHGSMPELGRNAVMMMVDFISAFSRMEVPYKEHPLLGGFSRSVNTLTGGIKTNVVPDSCTATMDLRTVPGQDHAAILRQVEEQITRLKGRRPELQASVRVLKDRSPVATPPEDPVVQRFAAIVAAVRGERSGFKGARYYTDGGVFAPALQAPLIICGPGEPGMAHQPDEYVDAAKLIQSARIYTQAAAILLS
jgi:succinyl-diaminopimelate desuccinylase